MEQTRVQLPAGVRPPLSVYVNGVEQAEGTDYEILGTEIAFRRELVREGKLGFWRWFLGSWGIGTYRKHECVDIQYRNSEGVTKVAHNVPYEYSGPPLPEDAA